MIITVGELKDLLDKFPDNAELDLENPMLYCPVENEWKYFHIGAATKDLPWRE